MMGQVAGKSEVNNLSAFTLVELLIVIAIIGILAALVIPKFSSAAKLSQENVVREDLRFLRSQIQVYRTQHSDTAPGYPDGDKSQTPTEEAFVEQMTKASDSVGEVADDTSSTHPFGPYLLRMPENPLNGLNTMRMLADADGFPTEAAGTHGWVYQPAAQRFACDAAGEDDSGVAYFNY